MKTETRFKKRIDAITEKFAKQVELSDVDKKILCIYETVDSFEDSIFFNSDFSETEPDSLNRHWVIHGRTRRIYTKYDFLKALLWLDAIIILTSAGEQCEEEKTE